MPKERTTQTEIGAYASTLLRKHFGKGPTSVFVTIKKPFVIIHFRGFLAPMEKILLRQNESKRVLETRDLLMNDLKAEIILELWKIAELDIKELYADWNLEKESGVIIGVTSEKISEEALKWPEEVDREAFTEAINEASIKAEKMPEETAAYWLNDRSILVRRSQILVEIEKELIKSGFIEPLKLAKRPLEQKVLKEVQLEAVLKRTISETFVDWNFDSDLGYIVFILDSPK
ncbi:DUF2294 domain-containing protein [Planococcus salinus]|uniref:DUF2294 family protein n=1 Tax=Planococcus salinus TaxID=1848460 RepID=A0A3M8PCJ0_9BACL|nr:Na-translocating system protein MpsC family protein [Planococcus salinus]RNF41292.1 DUF2294 family protein [Planococcus salinus]